MEAFMITLDDVKALAAAHSSPAVSILLPIHLPGPEARQDRPRMRNAAQSAEELLVERGCRPAIAREIVRPARELAEDREFWRHGGTGLALFLASGYARWYRVPTGLHEEVVVGDHFNIKQLLRLLEEDGRFFVLAVSTARARVLEGTRWSVGEVNAVRLPQGITAVKALIDYQDTVKGHPLARSTARQRQGMGMVSNAGEDPQELYRNAFHDYLTHVANAVNTYLSGRNTPVVIAALPDIEGHMRPHLRFEGLLSEWIDVNPDTVTNEELRDRAYALVRPALVAPREQELDHFATLKGNRSPKAGLEPAEIVTGARYARVDTLFIADGAQLWGRVDGDYQVELHDRRAPSDDDLLERAAVETLFHGGRTFVLPRDRFPTHGPLAAIFRY